MVKLTINSMTLKSNPKRKVVSKGGDGRLWVVVFKPLPKLLSDLYKSDDNACTQLFSFLKF